MDTPPHRLGLERVVEVFSGHDDLVGVTGSGYVIGPDLVLTSARLVPASGRSAYGSGRSAGLPTRDGEGQGESRRASCHVRLAGSARWTEAAPVWRGRGSADVVLLRTAEPVWADLPGIEHNRWARLATDPAPLRCAARGFAQEVRRGGLRIAETLSGLVSPPTGAVSKTLTFSVPPPASAGPMGSAEAAGGTSPGPERTIGGAARGASAGDEGVPKALWWGMCGAVLIAEPAGQLIGVVTSTTAGHAEGRLDVVPVTALLGDERFRELAGVSPGGLETVTGNNRAVPLPALMTPAREKLPPDCPDWTLLMARHAVVPFLGRHEELGELRTWATDEPGSLSIAVVSGRGGMGKTRLAGELCVELESEGWDAGFLPLDALAGPLAGLDTVPDPVADRTDALSGRDMMPDLLADRSTSFEALRPTLLVVDRPEPSAPLVGELIRRLAKHGHNPRVRLLLLVREPGETDWWRRLDTAAGGWLRRLNTTTVRLNSRPLTLQERTEHALAAMKAFAPSRAALPSPPRLDDPEYGLPLHVHLAALLRLCDSDGDGRTGTGQVAGEYPGGSARTSTNEHPDADGRTDTSGRTTTGGHTDAGRHNDIGGRTDPGGSGLLGRFLVRECDQWARVWPDGQERLPDVTARRAVAVLTLTAPTPAELPGLLTTVPGISTRAPGGAFGLHGSAASNAAGWLGRLFPPPPPAPGSRRDQRLTPLGPDLLAEQLLATTEGLDALVLAVHDHEGRTVEQLVRMLDVLRSCAGRERVRAALWALIAGRLGPLVAQAEANPAARLGDMLNAALLLFATDRRLAASVAALPPPRRTPDTARPDSPAATGPGLRALEVTLAELSVRHRRASGERIAPAKALTKLSAALAAVGRVGEAVVAVAKAVEVYAGAPPYEEAAGRAEAAFGLGACLLLGGEADGALKPAREAAARFRILAEDDPRCLEQAARAHYNVACALLGVGRLGEAVAAFEAAGGDAGFAANVTSILPVLPPADSLTADVSPARQPPTGTPSPAEPPPAGAPAPTWQTPAGGSGLNGPPPAGRPGPAAQSPGGISAPDAGRGPVAPSLQAPEPLTPFEGIGTAAALPELAACIAVAVTSAVRGVAPTSRDVAHRLHLIATWLEAYGRPADALRPATEAVGRLRTLAAEEPGLRVLLAFAASVLSRLHARLDDLDAAVRYAAEAVRNLRALVALEPDEHRPALAGQLLDLGELLLVDDRPEEALGPVQEAMTLPSEPDPATRARGTWLLGLCLDELGRTTGGLAQLELAAERYELLCAEDAGYARNHAEVRARIRRRPEPGPPCSSGTGLPWLLTLFLDRPEEAVSKAEQRLRSQGDIDGTAGVEQVHAHLSAMAMLARAWADAGRPADGFTLATRAAELLQRHAAPDGPHAIAVGMVAAALGRSLVGLGRAEEALPQLRTAIESYGPHAATSVEFRTELAELMILETTALAHAGAARAGAAQAEKAADRLVRLCSALVAEELRPPLLLAGALRLQAEIRWNRRDADPGQNAEAVLQSITRALGLLPSSPEEQDEREQLLAATCLELAGLCLAELHESDAARERLTAGTSAMARLGPVPGDLSGVHVHALLRLAEFRVEEAEPAAATGLYAQVLGVRPLPGIEVLDVVIERLSWFANAGEGTASGLVGPLTGFTEALEREVPPMPSRTAEREGPVTTSPSAEHEGPVAVSVPVGHEGLVGGGLGVRARFGRCLGAFAAAAERAGDVATAVHLHELAVRVHRGLAAVSGAHQESLGSALAALVAVAARERGGGAGRRGDRAGPAVVEQAIDLLGARQDRTLAMALNHYAAGLLEQGRAVEALAHGERAADLCDELDDPAVAAVTYAQLGSTLAALDRPQAALEAIAWSLAELDRAELGRPAAAAGMELERVRAQAVQVRGRVLRAFGREQEAMAHLVEALRLFSGLPEPLAAAETAGLIADDLLASGRPQDAAEYAQIAVNGHEAGTVKRVLATQRLARCHMMLGALEQANALVEELIPVARRSPDDLTYRAVLADSLAQSSELLPLLRLDDGVEAEARAREAIAIYDELLTTGMDAQAVHTSRAGACLTLAGALRMRELAAEAIQPLREAVAALERFSPGNPMQGGLLSRAMLMLGDALMEAERALEAGLVFHRTTQVTRDELTRAVAHARLGFCQQEMGRDDAADAALRVSADLLRELPGTESDLLRDVLLCRLKLLEKAGKGAEAKAVEVELRRLV